MDSTVLKLISRDTARRSRIFVGILALCSVPDDDKSSFSCHITLPVSASRKIIQLLNVCGKALNHYVLSIQCLYIIVMHIVFVLEENNVQLRLKYEYSNQILLTFEIHFEFFPLDFRQQHSF